MDHYKDNFHFQPSPLKPAGHAQLRVKTRPGSGPPVNQDSALHQANRKLLGFLYVYAILIASLYLTYAAYYFYQQHQITRLQQQSAKSDAHEVTAEPSASTDGALNAKQVRQVDSRPDQEALNLINEKLEGKLNLLERYVEMIAMDLQETKAKLREREKCDCVLSCTFNGTRYADKSSWVNQCDICTCQKCPTISCDDPIQLPGQCCPTCMKKCKHNNSLLKHGQKFTTQAGAKECRCKDGLIKCESMVVRQTKSVGDLVVVTTVGTEAHNLTVSAGAPAEAAAALTEPQALNIDGAGSRPTIGEPVKLA